MSNLLAQSGDIHPNPGPSVCRKSLKKNKTHIFLISAIFLTIICQLNAEKLTKIKMTDKFKYLRLSFESAPVNIKCEKLKHSKKKINKEKYQNNYVFLCLLLIISGDVKLNPGPKNCSLCRQPTSQDNNIQCSCCKKCYHISCDNDLTACNQNDFTWICPKPGCKPNYTKRFGDTNEISTSNKFKAPNQVNMNKNHNKQPRKKRKHNINKNIHKNKPNRIGLWNELTTITSEDYIGHEICFKCNKRIKQGYRLPCSICNRTAHIKCLKIKTKTIELNKNLTRICNLCSNEETEIVDKIKIKDLTQDEKPTDLNRMKICKNELLIIHLNARSIMNKIEDIQILCQNIKPDILCITETWLNDSVPSNAITPIGYKQIRCDRSDEFKEIYGVKKGGGIIVFYKEEIEIERKTLMKNDYEENVWLHVKTKQSFLLGTIYKTNYSDILKETDEEESKLEKYIHKAFAICDNVIILGDFNADLKEKSECPIGNTTKEIISTYGLSQIIEKPTRIDPKTRKSSTIDHIWIDKQKNNILKSGTAMGVSDHFAVFITLNIQKPIKQDKYIQLRNYKNYNSTIFNEELKSNLDKSNIKKRNKRV